jgi:hypothetical protein
VNLSGTVKKDRKTFVNRMDNVLVSCVRVKVGIHILRGSTSVSMALKVMMAMNREDNVGIAAAVIYPVLLKFCLCHKRKITHWIRLISNL